jgi:N4-gp56 family major capsid protein
LKNIPGFIRVEEYGQRQAMPGEVGSLDEVRFIETTNAKKYDGVGVGSIDVYGTLIFGSDFYAISRISGEAMKNIIEGPGGNADPLHQRQTSAWKATFVATILNDAFGLSLRHAVSA